MSLDYRHANQIITVNSNILWLGDIQAADDLVWIQTNNIRTIITVANGFNLQYKPPLQHYVYVLPDSKHENISQYFNDANRKINKGLKEGGVLVHCGAGVSRSATIVIAYLMSTKKMSFHQGLNFVRKKRSVVCPNLGFELQLKKYEKNLDNSLPQSPAKYQSNQSQRQKMKQTFLKFQPSPKAPIKSFTAFDKNPDGLARMTLMKQWKIVPKKRQTPFSLLPNKFSHSYQLKSNKKGPKDLRKQQLKKIAEFRFGITNIEKWKIY